MNYKSLIPKRLKIMRQLMRRRTADQRSGVSSRLAQKANEENNLPIQVRLEQAVMPGSTFAEKVQNLRLAGQRIEAYIIQPQEVFSFWHQVLEPNKQNGFAKSRNLVGGKLVPGYGGGL